jgi:iron-sulfur cluster assembly protein
MDQISGSASSSSSGAPVVPAVITISEKAAAQVRVIQQKENKLNSFLRVSVVGGGCSGLSYKLSFEDAPKEKDKILEFGDIKILIDNKSSLFLKGTELDFTDGLTGQGFVFTNPNAKSNCGCGSSFSA